MVWWLHPHGCRQHHETCTFHACGTLKFSERLRACLHGVSQIANVRTPVYKGHLRSGDKILSRKNVHTIFVSFTSVEGTPLFIEKGHFVFVPEPRFNLHLGDTFNSTQNVTDNEEGCLIIKVYTNHDNGRFHNMANQHTILQRNVYVFFCMHYLAAWINDCNIFRGKMKTIYFLFSVNY